MLRSNGYEVMLNWGLHDCVDIRESDAIILLLLVRLRDFGAVKFYGFAHSVKLVFYIHLIAIQRSSQ